VRLVPTGKDTLVSDCADTEALEYPVVDGTPVLVDFTNSILDRNATVESAGKSVVERKEYRGISRIVKRALSPRKKTTRDNVSALRLELTKRVKPARMLVIGGGSIGQGMEPFYDDPDIQIFAFDIYKSPHVQFIADAHQIPMPDEFFDAVVIQAVLEHVLLPSEVVAEIWRVLKNDGLVYAETPFMQQVHEGAYDFTRFTESGHRYLFRRFDVIRSGASGGPGIQFMWSVDYLTRSLFRSTAAGKLAKLAFFWTQYLDALVPPDYAIDGASGVFFLGRKTQVAVSPIAMAGYYQGAQKGTLG
jgi:SAM-dependent methyltransferase